MDSFLALALFPLTLFMEAPIAAGIYVALISGIAVLWRAAGRPVGGWSFVFFYVLLLYFGLVILGLRIGSLSYLFLPFRHGVLVYGIAFAIAAFYIAPTWLTDRARLKTVLATIAVVFLLAIQMTPALWWTKDSRILFLDQMWQVRKGMTVAEVETIMDKYFDPYTKPENFGTEEKRFYVLRHTGDPDYNSDFGFVYFGSDLRVTEVVFSPD